MPSWDPAQYEKFRRERLAPLEDLVALLDKRPGQRFVDLGCGTGEITALVQQALPGSTGVGLDASEEMLAQAAPRATEALSFARHDLQDALDLRGYDLVFSHAALQWVPGGEETLARITAGMQPGAQLAIQVPKNEAHPSHQLAAALAAEEPFRSWLGGFVRQTHALSLERYAERLQAAGFTGVVCIEKIYGHLLGGVDDVVEWVKGTLLRAYLDRLPAARGEAFLAAYRARLAATLGDPHPYFYAFRRALVYGIAPTCPGPGARTH